MFLGSGKVLLSEMATQKVRHVLHASFTVHFYAKKGARIAKYIIMRFCDIGAAVPKCMVQEILTGLLCGVQDCYVVGVELEVR